MASNFSVARIPLKSAFWRMAQLLIIQAVIVEWYLYIGMRKRERVRRWTKSVVARRPLIGGGDHVTSFHHSSRVSWSCCQSVVFKYILCRPQSGGVRGRGGISYSRVELCGLSRLSKALAFLCTFLLKFARNCNSDWFLLFSYFPTESGFTWIYFYVSIAERKKTFWFGVPGFFTVLCFHKTRH